MLTEQIQTVWVRVTTISKFSQVWNWKDIERLNNAHEITCTQGRMMLEQGIEHRVTVRSK